MNNVMLIDFGSTFTKVCAVDLDKEIVLGTAQAPTTVQDDICIGLENAMASLEKVTGPIDYVLKLGCSSAAGGLSVMVSGLIESLTMKGAMIAALGAGAKITRSFHHELTDEDLRIIKHEHPDIFLLAGGTDGGNKDVILGNAKKLASLDCELTVVVAGNRIVADEIRQILTDSGKETHVCPNIMPFVNKLNTLPVNHVIRNLFISKIMKAKGLDRAEKTVDHLLMPTPYAVLLAASLLADGHMGNQGFSELMVIDVGGATTDVHSVCEGFSRGDDVILKGLAEPRIMRTVEGDLGVRYNADSIVSSSISDGKDFFSEFTGNEMNAMLERIKSDHSLILSPEADAFDQALCKGALRTAVKRHCGTHERHYTPNGVTYLQQGKDLTALKVVIGTGGPLIHASDPLSILRESLYDEKQPESLRPKNPQFYLDRKYILSAMGLLSTVNPLKALSIMKNEIIKISQEPDDGSDEQKTV